ncbi:MAG: MFS transporter [Candidatus Binataceae bacterium]|nr:MFS transporter [Candidatus Binataceae bacterium]
MDGADNRVQALGIRGPQAAVRALPDSPRAWLMAATAFFSCFTIFGVVYSFGAFFKPMAAEFGQSRAHTSAVFSITACIYNLLGLAGGHLADRFGPRPIVITGAFAMGAGLVATSMAGSLWLGCVAYGLGVGVGVACVYVPMLAVVSGWFIKRRTTALGIAVSGVGGGTLVVAPIAAALIVHLGWRESYAILGVASALGLLGCALIIEAPPAHMTPAVAPMHLTAAMRTPEFAMLYAAGVLSSVAIYMPFVYLPDFAHGRGASQVAAAALVGVVGAASVAGRLGIGTIADRAGIIPLYKLSMLILGLSYGLWMVAHSYAALAVFALVMGAAYGAMIALSPAVVAELFGVPGLGALIGALYTSSAISALAGPPLAGFVIDRTGGYTWALALAGATAVAGFLIIVPLRNAGHSISIAGQGC